MKKYLPILIITMGLVTSTPAQNDNIVDILTDMAQNNAEGYLEPLPTAMGMSMNSGTFNRARPHKLLGFDITFNVGAVTVPDSLRTYDFYIPDLTLTIPVLDNSYDVTFPAAQLYDGDRTAQNVFGGETGNTYDPNRVYAEDAIRTQLSNQGVSDTVLSLISANITELANNIPQLASPRGLLSGGVFPILVPQVSLGLPMGLEVSLRGGIDQDIPDFGSIKYMGLGGKIGINRFIPSVPLVFPKLAVGFYTTNLNVNEILKANNSILNFQISKTIPFLTAYAGFGIENSNLKVEYDFVPDAADPTTTIPIKFDAAGENKTRTTLGVRVSLLLLTVHAEYNKGVYEAINAGIGISFR